MITPVPVKPLEIARRAVKMFDSELHSKNLQVIFEAHPSFQELNVEWMMFDPSRVLQILVCDPHLPTQHVLTFVPDQLDDQCH